MALLRFCCNGLGLQQFTRCQRATWQAAVRRMETAAFALVLSYNHYQAWHGRIFEDPDGCRVVPKRAAWVGPGLQRSTTPRLKFKARNEPE